MSGRTGAFTRREFEPAAVIVRSRNEARSGACEAKAKEDNARTASLKGKSKVFEVRREEPRANWASDDFAFLYRNGDTGVVLHWPAPVTLFVDDV
jgi:hypothetical protein